MSHRPLTPGEIALARTMFGDSLDYAAVRLHDRRILPPGLQDRHQAVAVNNDISFAGTSYSDDFGAEPDGVKQSVFIHEMCHVWQHQNRVLSTAREGVREMLRHGFNYGAAYPYDLRNGRDLTDYGFEQQAAMVQDYFLLTRHGDTGSFKNRRLTRGDAATLKRKYESVLKNFLKDPAYARGRRDRKRRGGPKP